jgi:predicted nucleic acid-binding protein
LAGLLIDSSVLIAAERGYARILARLDARARVNTSLSPITISEILLGAHRAQPPLRQAARLAFAEWVIGRFPSLPIDEAIAREHAALKGDLQRQGVVIGPHDLWLAATCLAHGLSIATLNLGEFRRVPGLIVEDWAA